ncbi:MAG: fatty acyl-AMP ligase [Acidobacteriota bacterium]
MPETRTSPPGDRGPKPTLVRWLQRAADTPDSGLRFLDRRGSATFVPWAEIHRGAGRVAASLQALGIRRGDRVALIYPTGLDFFLAFFGAQRLGAVPVPLYPPVRLGRLDEYHRRTAAMLSAAGAQLLLAERRIVRLLGQVALEAGPRFGCRRLDQLPAGGEAPTFLGDAEDLALVQFSSGTTVAPKPVALRHRHITSHVLTLNSFWPDDDEIQHSGVSWLPLYHDMGLIGCVFPALERPSVLTLIGPEVFVTKPALWLQAISTFGATISVAPNFAYGLATEKIRDADLDDVDLSSWRVALNGAESVSPSVLRAFTERFARWGFREEALTPVYGLSEATLAVTFSDLRTPFTSRCFDAARLSAGHAAPAAPGHGREMISVGRPVPGNELSIRNDDGDDCDEGQIGRVHVRGPSVMDGYLDRPDATARAKDAAGWLDTGDLGFMHRGELFLTGRAKDLLIVRGRNHAPEEIEQPVSQLAGVRTGCVAAVSNVADDEGTEGVQLFVECHREATAEELSTLDTRCREAVLAASGLRLAAVHLLAPGTLPRTSSGKLRRAETLRRHLAGDLSAPDAVNALGLLGAMARSTLAHARAARRRTADSDA